MLIVDCMVPGKMKKLGSKLVYLEPRRAQKLPAYQCEFAGGEYVVYDRADYSTALNIWLGEAQQGDARAQTFVGEIYEKGFGTVPDFKQAASWYRKAADQGDARAQLNLGHLYEKGLGVPGDKVEALNLYRNSAGLGADEIEFASTNHEAMAAARQHISELQTQVEQQDQQAESLRRQLNVTKKQLDRRRPELEAAREEASRLRRQLEENRKVPPHTLDEVSSTEEQALRAAVERQQGQIDTLEQERQALEQQLQQVTLHETQLAGELQMHQTEVDSLRNQAGEAQQQLVQERQLREQARVELDHARAILKEKEPVLQGNAAEIQRLHDAVRDGEVQVAALQARIAQLESQLQQQQGHLQAADDRSEHLQLQQEGNSQELESLRIQLSQAGQKEVIKQNEIANLKRMLEKTGVESEELQEQLRRKDQEVVQLNRELESLDAQVTTLSQELNTRWTPDVDFGRYFALIIGNSDYLHLTKLPTAANDAEQVDRMLKTHYGFRTRLLQNADRATIIQALSQLSSQLRENDNLLVYYAGHGFLNKAEGRGYWQAVDALPGNRHSWISDDQIAEFLSNMKSRHILVVADSCYSIDWTLSDKQIPSPPSAIRDRDDFLHWLEVMVRARTRMVLTSGGVQPVVSPQNGEDSVFTRAFLYVLQENDSLLSGAHLHYELYRQVAGESGHTPGNEGAPRYVPIRYAGHQVGEFFFKRQTSVSLVNSPSVLAMQGITTELLPGD